MVLLKLAILLVTTDSDPPLQQQPQTISRASGRAFVQCSVFLFGNETELGLERDVMTQFVGNVDALLQQPPRREHSSALSSRSATPHVDSLDASRAVVRNGGVTPLDDADARSEQSPIPDRVVPDPPVFQADSVSGHKHRKH